MTKEEKRDLYLNSISEKKRNEFATKDKKTQAQRVNQWFNSHKEEIETKETIIYFPNVAERFTKIEEISNISEVVEIEEMFMKCLKIIKKKKDSFRQIEIKQKENEIKQHQRQIDRLTKEIDELKDNK